MNAYTSKEELTLLPANRVSYPEHYNEARSQSSVGGGIVSRIVGYFARQRTLSELNSLSDRELIDIGLTRSELPMIFEPSFARNGR